MSEPKFTVGNDVYVRDPKRYVRDAVSITGRVDLVTPMGSAWKYDFDATIVRQGGSSRRRVSIHEVDLDHRPGTPASMIGVRPGDPGNDRLVEIGLSWGYP